MKKLEDIPKKDFLSAPEGYFEVLPIRISTRIGSEKTSILPSRYRYAFQVAVPVLVLAIVGVSWFMQQDAESTETLLANIETTALQAYLTEADALTYEEFIAEVNPSAADANALEDAVYELQWQDENLDELLNELENSNL